MNQPIPELLPPLSVLHVFRSPKGGLFRHVCDLIRAQHAAGLSVGVMCDSHGADSEAEKILEELKPLCSLGIHRVLFQRTPAISDLRVCRHLGHTFAGQHIDIIHGHGAKGGFIARVMAHRMGARSVYTPHGGTLHFTSNTLTGVLYLGVERLLKGRTDGIIFESRYVQQTYEEKVGRIMFESRVIYNGLHKNEFRTSTAESGASDFLFLGELRELKGLRPLIEACSIVAKTHPFTLTVAGSGPLETEVKSLIKQYGLENRLRLLGPVYPGAKAFKQARCLVQPSLAESMPYAVLEALAAGMPVIATRVGGVPEIFCQHSELLVSPGDAQALAKQMKAFLDGDSAFLSAMKQVREDIRNRFSAERMARRVDAFYQQVLSLAGEDRYLRLSS